LEASLGYNTNHNGQPGERAQEERILTEEERDFKSYLRAKALGMAAFQRARARQHSRLTWIRKGDSNTRFFQLHAKRRKKNYFFKTMARALPFN